MSGNNISPTKRRPFPQFARKPSAKVPAPKELLASSDALPEEKSTVSCPPKLGLKPAPARTVRPSSEAEFKRWLASQSQLQPASTKLVRPVSAKSGASLTARAQIVSTATQPRWRYESSSDQSAADDSDSIVEAESQSHVGLNAGSDSLGSQSQGDSYSESSETVQPKGRRSSADLTRRQVEVPPLELRRVRRTRASADRMYDPRFRLEKLVLQNLAQKKDLQSSLLVLNSILRLADDEKRRNQNSFSQSLHLLLINLTVNQKDALTWFEAQTQNSSSKNFGKWSEFVAAVNRSIQVIGAAAARPRPGDDDRGSEDESNVACLVLRRAPESSTLFDFVLANRNLRLV